MSLSLFTNTQSGGAYVAPTWWRKNVRAIPTPSSISPQDYAAFGNPIWVWDQEKIQERLRIAQGHLVGGKIWNWQKHPTVGTPSLIYYNGVNVEDCTTCVFDDGGTLADAESIVTISSSWNGFDGHNDHTVEFGFIRLDSDNNVIGGFTSFASVTTGLTLFDRQWIFGTTAYMDSAGCYAMAVVQYNTDSIPTTNNQMGIIVTDDYGATWRYIKVCDQSVMNASECIVIYCGSGKMCFMARQYGPWRYFTSTDDGETWTLVGDINLGFFNLNVKIFSPFREADGSITMIWTDRDAGKEVISRKNTVASFFATGQFPDKGRALYKGSTGVVSLYNDLGYPWIRRVGLSPRDGTSDLYYYESSKETQGDFTGSTVGVATKYGSYDDFLGSGVLPVAPTVVADPAGIDSSTVRFSWEGYTEKQLENITHYIVNCYSDSGHTTHITKQYQYGQGAVLLQDIWWVPDFFYVFGLSAGYTVYITVQAFNYDGSSTISSGSATSSP